MLLLCQTIKNVKNQIDQFHLTIVNRIKHFFLNNISLFARNIFVL